MGLEDELHQIDGEIRKLKIQFDLYFVGSLPRPPSDQREALEKLIRKYQALTMRSFADRFLYNSLVNKFNAYQELWTKGMKAKEEGVRVHPLAVRAAHQAALAQSGGSSGPPGAAARITEAIEAEEGNSGASDGAASGGPEEAERAPAAVPKQRPPEGLVASLRLSTTSRDEDALQGLYKNFVDAKSLAGDSKLPSFDTFVREITRHAAALKGKVDCDAIEFKIYYSGNKVSLKAKPAK